MDKKVYVLHEYGSNSHYNALKQLCDDNGFELVFREFRVIHLIGSGIEHKKLQRILKQFVNFAFLFNLTFTKGKKVVLGMHPYDWRLPILNFILRNHTVYYHTSFTLWHPKETKEYANTSIRKQERIKKFINTNVKHIFAVTQKAKDSLFSFCNCNPDKVTVVYHSYTIDLQPSVMPPTNTYIYVGRMDKDKGVIELLDYFSKRSNLQLTLIGEGELDTLVKQATTDNHNIHYEGFIKGLSRLMPFYQKNCFFILNSKRTKNWEELFGQVLIESMSCGCIPISVNHSGPKSVINDGKNGLLFSEGDVNKALDNSTMLTIESVKRLREAAIQRGHMFSSRKIAELWKPVLEN